MVVKVTVPLVTHPLLWLVTITLYVPGPTSSVVGVVKVALPVGLTPAVGTCAVIELPAGATGTVHAKLYVAFCPGAPE